MAARRVSWTWLLTAALLLVLLAGSLFFLRAHWRATLDEAQTSARRELELLASLSRSALQKSDYQYADQLLKDWGAGQADVTVLRLESAGGFAISDYRRAATADVMTLETPIQYAYAGKARLVLGKDLSPLRARQNELAAQVLGAQGVVLAMLGALARLLHLYRRESASLREEMRKSREAEEALRLTQFSLDRAPEGVFWIDRDAGVRYVNDEACRSLGYSREELLGMRIWDFAPDFPAEQWPQHWETMSQLGVRTLETRHRHRDGSVHPVEISVVKTTYGDQEHHTAFVRDITRRKADEDRLRRNGEQQATLREMMEIVVKGDALEDVLGQCLERLLAISWLALLPEVGIFLLDEAGESLHLKVSRNLHPEIVCQCARVALGHCHCGRAAASREMQFSQWVDHRHEIGFPGMTDHGHYNLPLLSEGDLLGVMMLYLPPGFERDPAKEQFLTTVADILAGFIRRQQAKEELRQLTGALEDRVEQRTAELVAAKEEAERASRTKSEFLSRMSHELRTPLNAILGFGQLLEMEARDPEQADSVQEILHAGRHLLDLINEVLDLARIEAGRMTVSLEPVPLTALLQEALTLIQPLAEARAIRLIPMDQPCPCQVLADRVRFKQVLLNLLSNAVKYNRQGGEIRLACVADGRDVQVRVTDTGPGLTPEQQARLFVAFERLDADQAAIEGTGIGLALSRRLVEIMGGQIGVDSTPGAGSTFWVRLPACDHHPA